MEFHCSCFTLHPGATKMYHDLRRQYYWSGIKKQVGDFVQRCLTCQQVKAEHQGPTRLLHPLEVGEWKWEHVTMDFVTHFPQTLRGHDAVWVVVDRLTKLAYFLVVRMTFTLEEYCMLYIQEIIWLHGVPVSIVSNRDPRFTTHFLGEFLASYRDTIDDEHSFSSSDERSVIEDHLDVRGHATGMCPRS